MAATMDYVVKTLRGLLNSTPNGLLERQLRRECKEMEGCEIPYKSFGCNTLLDFLRTSNQFELSTTNDGVVVQAKLTQSSMHVVELVGTQNRAKRKKNVKSMPFVPRLRPNFSGAYSKVSSVNLLLNFFS